MDEFLLIVVLLKKVRCDKYNPPAASPRLCASARTHLPLIFRVIRGQALRGRVGQW